VIRYSSGLISLLIVVVFATTAPVLRAQRGAPPPPKDMVIRVKREVRTEIPLLIYGRRNEQLKFLIHKPPEHGQITEPQQTGKESAAVIYDPPADLSITHDRFFYSVQSVDGVSSPVEVSITIVDAPPVFVTPGPVDFPRILAGTTSTKIIELSNRGGGLAVGEMVVDAPWQIVGSSTYRIKAGEVVAFKVVFAPKEGGAFEGAISFSSNREHSTVLHGEAYTPVSASPAKVVMANALGDPVRTSSFELSNQTDQGRTVQIHADGRLLMPGKVSIPAHDKVNIPIQTPASDVAPIDAEIRIESDGFSLSIPVKSPAVEPMFKVSANRVSLGRQPAAKPGAESLVIENMGGLPGTVTLTVAAPFIADPSKVVVGPGEKKSIRITLAPSAPGKYRTWLQVTGGRQEMNVGLEAELYASAAKARAPGVNETGDSPEGETLNGPGGSSRVQRGRTSPATIPAAWGTVSAQVHGLKLLRTTPNSATFQWPEKLSNAGRFRFEFRHLGLNASRELMASWIEHHPATVEQKNGYYIATLGDLQPNQNFAVQVLPLNSTGQPEPRLFAFEFSTPKALRSTSGMSSLQWLILAIVICVGLWIWRAVRNRTIYL
jgi:hypothetical protein